MARMIHFARLTIFRCLGTLDYHATLCMFRHCVAACEAAAAHEALLAIAASFADGLAGARCVASAVRPSS